MKNGDQRRKVSHVSGAPESELLENKVECYSSKYRLYICKKNDEVNKIHLVI